MDFLKEFLIAIGGGATALIAVLTVFKSMFLKVFDKSVDTTFEKKLEKYRDTLCRTTTAYEFILRKEMEFYEKIDPHFATIVPLVQDLVFFSDDETKECEKFREHYMTYLQIIPQLKNTVVLYQPYITEDVFKAVFDLVTEMQNRINFWKETCETLFGVNNIPLNSQETNEASDAVLMRICVAQTIIKKRLTALSNA